MNEYSAHTLKEKIEYPDWGQDPSKNLLLGVPFYFVHIYGSEPIKDKQTNRRTNKYNRKGRELFLLTRSI